MGLSNRKEEQLRKMPLVQSKLFKSQDGRFIVHKTIFTDVKPTSYYEKVVHAPATNDIVADEEGLQEVML